MFSYKDNLPYLSENMLIYLLLLPTEQLMNDILIKQEQCLMHCRLDSLVQHDEQRPEPADGLFGDFLPVHLLVFSLWTV